MKQTETAILLKTIKTAYPYFEITKEVAGLWHEFMKDITMQQAQINLRDHIRSSKFAPTIADIVRHDPNQYVNYDQLRQETQVYLQGKSERQQQAVAMPEHIKKFLLKGGDPE